jgi:uncharacterized membrane protein
VNFTAALVPTSFLFDLLGAWRKNDRLLAVGWWTLLLAACLTPVTILFGWLWMGSMADMDHWQMPVHKWLGTSLGAALIVLAIWRGWLYRRERGPGWSYAAVAAVLLLAFAAQGDLGASMSFEKGIVFSSSEEHEATHDQNSDAPAHDHPGAVHDHDSR